MNISIVIPAYNEEAYLEDTLNSIEVAAARILLASSDTVEVIVVDNDSEDATAGIALSRGANVIHEPVRGFPGLATLGRNSLAVKCSYL